MKPDGHRELFDSGEKHVEFRRVQWLSPHIRVDQYAPQVQFTHAALEFPDCRVNIEKANCCDTDEPGWMALNNLGHAIVSDAGEHGSRRRVKARFQRRCWRRDRLHGDLVLVHDSKSDIDIGECLVCVPVSAGHLWNSLREFTLEGVFIFYG